MPVFHCGFSYYCLTILELQSIDWKIKLQALPNLFALLTMPWWHPKPQTLYRNCGLDDIQNNQHCTGLKSWWHPEPWRLILNWCLFHPKSSALSLNWRREGHPAESRKTLNLHRSSVDHDTESLQVICWLRHWISTRHLLILVSNECPKGLLLTLAWCWCSTDYPLFFPKETDALHTFWTFLPQWCSTCHPAGSDKTLMHNRSWCWFRGCHGLIWFWNGHWNRVPDHEGHAGETGFAQMPH